LKIENYSDLEEGCFLEYDEGVETCLTAQVCKFCGRPLKEVGVFCQWCGKRLSWKDEKISSLTQVMVYLVAFLLPPLGLGWAWKYYRMETGQGKKVAAVIVVLTAVSIVISLLLFGKLINMVNESMGQFGGLENLDGLMKQ
jgi:hypothetical protein